MNNKKIALQCPVFYGNAVFQARVVLFDLYKQSYMSDCEKVQPNNNDSKRLANTMSDENKENITVYPNPANTVVYVNAKDYDRVIFKLYNIIGDIVLDKPIDSNEKIDVDKLSNGVYIYKLYHNDTELKVGKLMITK